MRNELTNLLPPERQREFHREYLLRFGTVAVLLFSGLVFAAAALLVPAYLFLDEGIREKEARIATLETEYSSSEEAVLFARLTTLSDNAKTLAELADTPTASSVLRGVLAVSRPGVVLSGFGYSAAAGKNPSTLAVSGVAATREALRSYQIALESPPFSRSANMPVSAYAKDANIPFTITITLAP